MINDTVGQKSERLLQIWLKAVNADVGLGIAVFILELLTGDLKPAASRVR
jgi:hypothetical protein